MTIYHYRRTRKKWEDRMKKFPNSWLGYPYLKKGLKYRQKIMDSGFTEGQTCGALDKAWLGFNIAKANNEYDNLIHYGKIIQKLSRQLGIDVPDFSDIGLPASEAHKWDYYGEEEMELFSEDDELGYDIDDDDYDSMGRNEKPEYEMTKAEIDYANHQKKISKGFLEEREESKNKFCQ